MTRSFTKFVAAIIITLGFSSATFAQDNNADIIRPITKQGSAAFLFTLQGLGTFGLGAPSIGSGDVVTAGAGMKYYLNDDLALRILLAFNNTSMKNSDASDSAKPGTTQFGVGIGAEYHFRPLYSTSPYVGGQISFTNSATDNDLTGDAKVKTSRNSFAVAALAGFDWFFTRGMAAGAEYQLGFATTGGTVTVGSNSTDLATNTTIGLSGGGNVHLVVYF